MKLALLLLLLVVSCGKEKNESKKSQAEEFDEDGLFYGVVEPINKARASGAIKISKYGDSVQVVVKFKGPASSGHEHFLYESSDCPRSDMDGNGTIDAAEVAVQAGERIMAFDAGIQESSYHLMLADLSRKVIKFEERTYLVFSGAEPVGCASIDRVYQEPTDESDTYEPQRPRPPRRRPKPEEPDVKPPPAPPEDTPSWWDRLTDRLRQWWCRVRRRCG